MADDALRDPAHEEQDLSELGTLLGEGCAAGAVDARGATSDLSLDEILLLHSAGLAPAQVAFGVGCAAIPAGSFTWSTGPVEAAQAAFRQAFEDAKAELRRQAGGTGALGVVGVDVEVALYPYYSLVTMVGTAVRALTDEHGRAWFRVRYDRPFLCDLSARDFAVLSRSGWYPCDLVAGASFVHAPRRSMGSAISQATQNVELTNMTETLYDARERAMDVLQEGIRGVGGTGLVDVTVMDHPVWFASHVVEFVAWGTAIVMVGDEHRHPQISVVVPLDERTRQFEATSLD
jgi:uncharacterized protein YbjQ (UPF0145 family)